MAETGPRFTRFGSGGDTLVLLHGWCCTSAFWRHQIDRLAGSCSLIAVDLGHPDPEHHDFSLARAGADIAARLTARLAATTDGPLTLIGHSMGGPIALEAALRLGSRCRQVIGVDTFTDAAFYRRLAPEVVAARTAPFRADFPGAMRAMIDAITLAGGAALRTEIAGVMAAAPPASALRRLEALLDWDILDRWSELACPVAAINSAPLGEGTAAIPLPGLVERRMPAVGHFPMLEAPEAFAAELAHMRAASGAA